MFLGVNAFFHDSSAAIVNSDGTVIAAVQEERFSRQKRDGCFPVASIRYCLEAANITPDKLRGIGFAWHPRSFLVDQILACNLMKVPCSPTSIRDNLSSLEKLYSVPKLMKHHFPGSAARIGYLKHHRCHAASAYFASGFDEAAFLTIDGQGELK